jgi:transposase
MSVNPEMDVKTLYNQFILTLTPSHVPCIYCDSSKTHSHGTYPRRPYEFQEKRELWRMHRRYCPHPDCGRTFALLPAILAPYARFVIVAQDMAVAHVAEGMSYEQTAIRLDEQGISPSESTLRRWFGRMQDQTRHMLPMLSSMLQNEKPERRLPALRKHVRDSTVCAYYNQLEVWGKGHSGAWNLLRLIICLFAPSVSANRASYGLSPD